MPEETKIEEAVIVPRTTSPVVEPEKEAKEETFDFPEAMRKIAEGIKVTKLEWGDVGIYGYLSNNTKHVTLHKTDGKDYDWVLSEGDIIGKDWVIIK